MVWSRRQTNDVQATAVVTRELKTRPHHKTKQRSWSVCFLVSNAERMLGSATTWPPVKHHCASTEVRLSCELCVTVAHSTRSQGGGRERGRGRGRGGYGRERASKQPHCQQERQFRCGMRRCGPHT